MFLALVFPWNIAAIQWTWCWFCRFRHPRYSINKSFPSPCTLTGVLRWSDWGSCTRTCGSGFETRVAICRDIDSHENCTSVGQLMIDRRRCEGLSECPSKSCSWYLYYRHHHQHLLLLLLSLSSYYTHSHFPLLNLVSISLRWRELPSALSWSLVSI